MQVEGMPFQSLLVKISICDTNGISFSKYFRFLKMVKKSISRTAIISVFSFKITMVFESLLLKEKPLLKFTNTVL